MQHGARERDSLLLAARQQLRPVLFFIEAPDQMFELAIRECRTQLVVAVGAVVGGIAQLFAQRAYRQVRFLRQEQHGAAGGPRHGAAAERPDAGQGTEQRALA